MGHIKHDTDKLILRVKRIRGQLNAIERSLESDADCGELFRSLAACRGGVNSLMSEVIEGHIKHHVLELKKKATSTQATALAELMEIFRTYLK